MKEEKRTGETPARGTVCYKSNLLNKVFDSYDELVKAEEEFERINSEKIKKAEEKKQELEKIDDAYKKYLEILEDKTKAVSDAWTRYVTLVDEFAKKYGGYHKTYTSTNSLPMTASDSFDELVNAFRNLPIFFR